MASNWRKIYKALKAGETCCLLLIIESIGSSPGRQGFKMVVFENGDILGSIGGGTMEFALVEEAREIIKQPHLPAHFIKRQIHQGRIKHGSGMICSGEQTVLFLPLGKIHIDLISQVLAAREVGDQPVLSVNPTSIELLDSKAIQSQFQHKIREKEWFYKERIGQRPLVYIVGAGHVGYATSRILDLLEFEVVLLDNRAGLNTFVQNNTASRKEIIEFKNVAAAIPENPEAYVLVMTHKFKEDRLVLEQLLEKEFKYLGVLGSKRKLEIMFAAMIQAGTDEQKLKAVKGPLGLSINSQTPDEIAISIAAEIISVRNAKN